MKQFALYILLAFAISFVGCQTNEEIDTPASDGYTLSVSIPSSRTALGTESNNLYPVYWSEGDCIVVNGEKSHEAVIGVDKCSASFSFDAPLSAPLNITYPYCEATTATTAKVHFLAEQSYTEDSFAPNSAPMCGYAESLDGNITMKHLSGLLRFAIKGEGHTLSKVVITSKSAKLAGDFTVKCNSGALSPSRNATNSVTYTLPSDFTLSANEERLLYIALPAVESGACEVHFFDSKGGRMVGSWSEKRIEAGIVRKFKTLTYEPDSACFLEPWVKEEDSFVTAPYVSGYVTDTHGNGIEGVAVSDGFNIVTTASNGYYSMEVSSDAWYIFITIPAEYEISIGRNGQPDFYKRYKRDTKYYDFTLKPLANGKEEKFALFTIGDPQVADANGLNRLNSEAIPAIKAHASELQAQGMPCYGITLGDLISNNNSSDRSEWRDDLLESFHASKVGMPVFHVMGNHDNTFFNTANLLIEDEFSSTYELKAQRDHEEVFGPVNFSFDRGDMHIISMRNLTYNANNDCESNLRRSFLPEQYRWLKQDLALVPKDKSVILCVHLPMLDGGGSYVDMTRELINEYKEAHIMSGHSHLIQTIEAAKQKNIYEHNMGALCGAWWTSYMCGDGSPCGWGVFVGEGTTFTDWYHIGYDKVSKSRSHQMRLYRGNSITGKATPSSNPNLTRGYYAFGFEEDVLLANVYMADSKWSIKVYEDGEYSGDMVNISVANGLLSDKELFRRPKIYRDEESTPSADGAGYGYMVGDGTLANPYTSTVATSGDIYFSGYINGVLGYSDWKVGSNSQCYHMYMYKLKNKNASIKVVATDRFGNEYTETKITDGTDYSSIQY